MSMVSGELLLGWGVGGDMAAFLMVGRDGFDLWVLWNAGEGLGMLDSNLMQ